jgi:RNA polymerase sigma factor (sigma-70 family)
LTNVRSRVRVADVDVDESEFTDRLRESERSAVRLLLKQLKHDQATSGSTGLALVSKAFSSKLMSFLKRFFRDLDDPTSHAEEALNDTLVRILSRCAEYDYGRAKFRTWVFQQARYAALDIRRTARREAGLEPVGGDSFDTHEVPLTEREKRALRRAFRSLTPTQQRLLHARYVQEHSPTEISRLGLAEGIQETHVKVYVNRAATKLAQRYSDELKEEV